MTRMTVEELKENGEKVYNLCDGSGPIWRITKQGVDQIEIWYYIPNDSLIGRHKHPEREIYQVIKGRLGISATDVSSGSTKIIESNEEHWAYNNSGEDAMLRVIKEN